MICPCLQMGTLYFALHFRKILNTGLGLVPRGACMAYNIKGLGWQA